MPLFRVGALAASLLAFLAISPSNASSQSPVLLKDINQVSGKKNPSSDPKDFATLGSLTYFAATTAGQGRELWVTDGSPTGTRLLADLVPGQNGSDPQHLTVAGPRLFFLAWDPTHGRELWQSDGTKAGTTLVLDIRPGAASSEISYLVAVGGRVYFVADDGTHGAELWISDGIGATLVKDIHRGSAGSDPKQVVAVGSQVFFTALVPATGRELYRSDGSQLGTLLVSDLTPGSGSSALGWFAGTGNLLYFAWGQSPQGQLLWRSDGTAKGTQQLAKKDWDYVVEMVPLGNRLLVVTLAVTTKVTYKLFVTNGTTTTLLQSGGDVQLRRGVRMGQVAYYVAGTSGGVGLWKTDGTLNNTVFVKTLAPLQMQPFGTGIAILGRNPLNTAHTDLWFSDGTNQGTKLKKTFKQNSKLLMHGSPSSLAIAMDDAWTGRELWVRQSSPTSTGSLTDLDSQAQNGNADPRILGRAGKWLLFGADDGLIGYELWRTDGTSKGTSLVKDIQPGKASGAPWGITLGSSLVFSANDGKSGGELWRSDGTAAGTVLVKDIQVGPKSSGLRNFTRSGNHVYFIADDGIHGTELWRTDGTTKGTHLVFDLTKGAMPSFIFQLTAFRGEIYFVLNTTIPYPFQLWRSDGTPQGTRKFDKFMVADPLNAGPDQPVVYRGHLYFQAYTYGTGTGHELWRTDGTVKGTGLFKDLVPGGSSWPNSFMVAGDLLYFRATTPQHGEELWRSDGTVASTQLVVDLTQGTTGSKVTPIGSFGEELIFYTYVASSRLWRTRGTAASTHPLPEGLNAWKSTLVAGSRRMWGLARTTAVSGLWSSDGNARGTRLESWSRHTHPIGGYTSYGSMPIRFFNGRLYFASWDAIRGTELWSLDPGAITEPVGHACSPTHLLPEMSASDPVLGGSMEFKGIKTPSNAAALLLLGAQANLPAPLTPSCSLYVDLRVFAIYGAFLTQGDTWKQVLFLPNQTSLHGIQVMMQTVFFRPGSGFSATQGRLLTLGH